MTMKELAKLAGVSPAAISRYLNGGPLSEEKRRIIRAAIEKTGYQPDPAAQSLRTRSTDVVGLIVPKLDSESVSRLTAGASEVLAGEGYACQLGVSLNDPEKEFAFLQLFQSRSVAGVILMGTVLTPGLESFFQNAQIPVVVAGQKFKGVPCVYHDDFGAALELTRLVLARGRRRPVFIGATRQDAAAGLAVVLALGGVVLLVGLESAGHDLIVLDGDRHDAVAVAVGRPASTRSSPWRSAASRWREAEPPWSVFWPGSRIWTR